MSLKSKTQILILIILFTNIHSYEMSDDKYNECVDKLKAPSEKD